MSETLLAVARSHVINRRWRATAMLSFAHETRVSRNNRDLSSLFGRESALKRLPMNSGHPGIPGDRPDARVGRLLGAEFPRWSSPSLKCLYIIVYFKYIISIFEIVHFKNIH